MKFTLNIAKHETHFQILGLFYLILAVFLVGTNIGRRSRNKVEEERMNKKQTVQVLEGSGVKCEVVGKQETVYLEEEV